MTKWFLLLSALSARGFRLPPLISRASHLHETSRLEQLSEMTTLSIDSGDLSVIRAYADTGFISDATTNPLFVCQAGLSGDPAYAKMVDDAVAYAAERFADDAEAVPLAMDRLAVNLGKSISAIVPGYVSTEVDPRLSFDVPASVSRGRRIAEMYESANVPRSRVLVKLAATWEGIRAAEILEGEGILCNLTLIFSLVQAVAAAQRGARLVSPFPGRVLDWHNARLGRSVVDPAEDDGVVLVKRISHYYEDHSHGTICMPASWRPSRGSGHDLDEILALAGVDRMTIPAPLLEKLAGSTAPLRRNVAVGDAARSGEPLLGGGLLGEEEFRFLLNMDGCGTDKLAEGIRAFVAETDKLERVIVEKLRSFRSAASST